MTKPKVLILTTIWGHKSIAQGVYDCLKNSGFDIRLEEIKIDPFSKQSYKAFYRFTPGFFKAFFNISKYDFANKSVHKYFERRYFRDVTSAINREKPDIVINTYMGFDSSIVRSQKNLKFKYFNVIPDPWTFSKISVSKKGTNLVFDNHAENKMRRLSTNYAQVGWFTQEKYYEKMNKSDARKKLNIDKDKFTICAAGGSEGTFELLKIISSLVGKRKNLQILFMCGDNKQLFDLALRISKIVAKTTNIQIIPYKFTDHMELFYKASDLVIGKAGPNTIFECVACGVPFFAITHVHGQEDGNLELIKKYNIGYVDEDIISAAKKIKKIIKNPSTLNKFKVRLEKLAEYNQISNQKFLEIIFPKNK